MILFRERKESESRERQESREYAKQLVKITLK